MTRLCRLCNFLFVVLLVFLWWLLREMPRSVAAEVGNLWKETKEE